MHWWGLLHAAPVPHRHWCVALQVSTRLFGRAVQSASLQQTPSTQVPAQFSWPALQQAPLTQL
jgi:hypothetical protein